jgi:two-component system sensor histidine kinase CreC
LLSILFLLGMAVVFAVDEVNSELKPRYREAAEETLADTAFVLATFVEVHSAGADEPDVSELKDVFEKNKSLRFRARIYDLLKDNVDLRVSATDEKGRVLYDSYRPERVGADDSRWRDVILALRGEYGARTTRDDSDDPSSTVLYVAAPIHLQGRIAGTLTVAKPTKSANAFIAIAQQRLFRGGLLMLAALTAVSGLAVVFITRPIRQLILYARDVRDGKPARLPSTGSSDVAELGSAFEEMRESLEGKNYIERYVQTLTHELKSPLAAIRGAAELLGERELPAERRQQFLENIRGESQRMTNIIERLLELAALEKQQELVQPQDVFLPAALEEVLSSLAPQLTAKALSVEWKEKDAVTVPGDPFLLRQALRNILDNGVDFSPSGGRLRVSIRRDEQQGQAGASVNVEDCGSGIPDYAEQKIFERFFSLPRADTGRKGSGLGLAFVAEIVKLHRGTVAVSNKAEPPGVSARIFLPLNRS